MFKNKIREIIENYPDFPKKGINFKDISSLLLNASIFNELIDNMSSDECIKEAEALVAIDARGFIFASSIGYKLCKPIILARKSGKLPGNLITDSYDLEYGQSSLSIQKKALANFESFAIVDDLLATGGTINCVSNILKSQNKIITAASVVVELSQFESTRNLNMKIVSQICY